MISRPTCCKFACDAKLGAQVEIWAVLTGYVIEPKTAASHPVLIVDRFEPK